MEVAEYQAHLRLGANVVGSVARLQAHGFPPRGSC